ncbi:uncharacterized protein LOC142230809 [Haematobia irritans]|uniref:uncharacterized protein LOC142230809 n=1 Tax=Haematobia irritans TaxID=7368 RepID=UPI003F5061EA
MATRHMYESNLHSIIPSIEDWDENRIHFGNLNICTCGTKMAEGTGSGICCKELELKESFKLDNKCSIFQAEIFAIAKAAELLSMKPLFRSDISIFIDSQAAIKALGNTNIRSKVVSRRRRELAVLTEQHNVTLCWVPGHCGINGNEEANVLVKEGEGGTDNVISDVFCPLSLFIYRINSKYEDLWKRRWASSIDCEQTKLIWDENNIRNSEKLMSLQREDVRSIITGHNALRKQMVRISLANYDICTWCLDPEATEDSFQDTGLIFLSDYDRLAKMQPEEYSRLHQGIGVEDLGAS